MEDFELIQRIENDDRSAFDILFRNYYKRLVHYTRSYVHDIQIAEDIVQQVFLDLWLNRHQLHMNIKVSSFLYWKCYTSFIDHYRKVTRRAHILEAVKEEALRDSITEDHDITNTKIKKLKQLIETLSPACKEVLELNKMRGLKYDEIAEMLNISKKTVESHMRTAYQRIREGFKDHGMFIIVIFKKLRRHLK
ncbi:MAG TPA: RNA polymerase sigma-70 factor [Flavobacteriaceae bacterium]|jgi:RNA polymerase sigma-70 factor (ECF subfamily)